MHTITAIEAFIIYKIIRKCMSYGIPYIGLHLKTMFWMPQSKLKRILDYLVKSNAITVSKNGFLKAEIWDNNTDETRR